MSPTCLVKMKLLNAQCKVEVVSKLLNPHIHLSGSGVCGRSGSAWCFHSLLVCKGNREPTACTSHVTQPLPVAAWGAHGGRGGGSPASAQAHPALRCCRDQTPPAPPPTLPGSQWQSLILTWVIYKHLKSTISLHLLTVRTEKLGGKPSHHPPNEQSVWVVQGN